MNEKKEEERAFSRRRQKRRSGERCLIRGSNLSCEQNLIGLSWLNDDFGCLTSARKVSKV